jgi:hypothetical protein
MPETTTPDAATLDAFWGLFENRFSELNFDDPEIASKAQSPQARLSDLQKPSAHEQELAAQLAVG